MDPLRPRHGVRLLLEVEDAGPSGARYRGAIGTAIGTAGGTAGGRHEFAVVIERSGAAVTAIEGSGEAAPAAVEMLRAIARTVGRHAFSADPPAWPRRVVRWRRLREEKR